VTGNSEPRDALDESSRAVPRSSREGDLNWQACRRVLECHEIYRLRRKIAEDDASDTHGELSFASSTVLDTNQGGFANHALTRKSRVRRKFNLNLTFRAWFGHLSVQRQRVAGDQKAITMHVGRNARNRRVPLSGKRQHTRQFHFNSFVRSSIHDFIQVLVSKKNDS
jgi:hypothetical protein